ncbi:Cation/H+ exchanger, partial [Dillenia turbinata]
MSVVSTARSDKETRERFYGTIGFNSSASNSSDGSIAKMFDRVLEEEFSDNDRTEGPNNVETLIDRKDYVFVMSSKKSKYPVLKVDLRLLLEYLLAGSLIGPVGLKFISEMVQLKVVGPVAVLVEFLQIVMFMFLSGIIAMLCGAKLSEGVFAGSFLSMSSTAVVVKCLIEKNSTHALHGQVTIGTLMFQDCAVGLLFALLPVLGGNSGLLQGMVAYSDKLGLSLELGSFVAGVMISTTDFAQHTLDQVESIRNLFAALFLSSIGMLIHVHFLWNHTAVITIVTRAYEYNIRASFVGKMYLLLLGTTALSLFFLAYKIIL